MPTKHTKHTKDFFVSFVCFVGPINRSEVGHLGYNTSVFDGLRISVPHVMVGFLFRVFGVFRGLTIEPVDLRGLSKSVFVHFVCFAGGLDRTLGIRHWELVIRDTRCLPRCRGGCRNTSL